MKLCPSVKNGLHFSCKQCGKCCSNEQDGYVFIYQEDIDNICKNLKISEEDLAEKYFSTTDYDYDLWDENLGETKKTKVYPTLILNNEKNQNCAFLIEAEGKKLCKIYKSRPLQCKIFPFWNVIITSEEFFLSASHSCPGINCSEDTKGFFSPEKIKELVYLERKMEYDYYTKMKNCDFEMNEVYPFLKKIKPLSKKK
ncbi:hypothetical protein NEF87_001182 [Candidatus Lokiarchaeum ossiferum]|uniref:YkgJ family cysteine cluster protein n=1 Tax=Candidatus Lokiarchaeum ossiferum TaxID=2951803 RepID=A0ABY6HN22_9ARCH|nr:hypothetical protein NEF87_001182 [Candidatus Lokiarchaeum sp. B-35]